MNSEFPKIIHQIWWQGRDKIPCKFNPLILSWKQHHPKWKHIIWDESNSSYDGCLELPKLSTVAVGHTVNVYAWGNNIASVTFQHADDTAAGNKMCNAYAWSGAYTTANGIRAHSNVSYRFIKFVKIQRTIIKNGAYSFWLVMLFDTLNA